jgi:periplasmic divalent cation tolerance protein
MSQDKNYIVIFSTASSQEEAQKIAEKLVAAKLAACVNSLPVSSLFTWKGKTEKEKEILLIIKSKRELFTQIEQMIKQDHSYEVPEIICLPISLGSKSYLDWIEQNTA